MSDTIADAFVDRLKNIYPPMWTIYEHPADHPQHFVVRLWYGATPTQEFSLHASLIEAREQCVENGGSVPLARGPNDEPQIVETWI